MKNKLIFLSIMSVIIFTQCAYANQILKTIEKEERISEDTILKKYEMLTSDGWIEANLLELDANSQTDKISLLYSEEGTKKLAKVSAMSKVQNTVAGINGDFFSGRSGIGSSIGLAINDGEIYSSGSENNSDIYTTFAITEKGKMLFEYLNNTITLYVGKNQKEFDVRYINKYTDDAKRITIYTPTWGNTAIGSTESLNVTEVVVKNGKVYEVLKNDEPAEIPEDGFVIMFETDSNEELLSLLKTKTEVSFEVSYEPDVEKIDFAISGGTKLIESGIIPESYSHTTGINGRNPRTVLGINKDKSKIYLITIDGRSEKSTGTTLEETSEILKELKIYTAINLDGGGSTTMVQKSSDGENYELVNNPSEKTERFVANGIGIINTEKPTTKVDSLVIKLEDHNLFVGDKRKISVIAYDKNYNIVSIDEEDIKWDYTGTEVIFEDGYVYGETVGTAKIIAKIGKIKATEEINILSNINELYIYPKEKSLNINEELTFKIKAKNKNGYYANIDESIIKTDIYKYYQKDEEKEIPEEASFENLTFKSSKSGTYILRFKHNDFESFAKVVIGEEKFVLIDDFEKETFTFDPYPDEVGGSATLYENEKYSGKNSVKLEYDFDVENTVRGAYVVLNNEAIIPKEATKVSFMLYNEGEKDEDVKIKFRDANDKYNMIVIEDAILHDGWKEIVLDVTSFEKPLYVTDIYLAQNVAEIKNKGYVLIDKFGYYQNETVKDNNIKIPKDNKIEDSNNFSVNTEKSFDVAFISPFKKPETMIDCLKLMRFTQNINSESELLVLNKEDNVNFKDNFVEDIAKDDYGLLSVEKIETPVFENNGYDLYSNSQVTIITMDVQNNSIRLSDEEQFFNFEDDIKDDDTGNIIIVLNGTLDNFVDERERKLFVDTLCNLQREENKKIIVVQDGFYQDYQMERGVKFLSIKENENSFIDTINSAYLLISVNGKEMSYEYRKIF